MLSASQVKTIRTHLGYSQKELAALLDVSVRAVQQWEAKGAKGVAAKALEFLADNPPQGLKR